MAISDKNVHLIVFFLCCIFSIGIVLYFPELLKDVPTTFGTIGFCLTGYGIVFAIIELHRAKTASLLAREAATKVFETVTMLTVAREIAECQSVIYAAVCAIDEGKTIPSAILQQIVKLYTQVFHAEITDENSPHRKIRSTIQSYTFNPNARTKAASSRKTKEALLLITGYLAEIQGATKQSEE